MRDLDLRKQLKSFAKGLIKGACAEAAGMALGSFKNPTVGKLPSMVNVAPTPKNQRTGVRQISKKLKETKESSGKRKERSENKKKFPAVVEYSGKIVTPGYDPKKAELYKKNDKKNAKKKRAVKTKEIKKQNNNGI